MLVCKSSKVKVVDYKNVFEHNQYHIEKNLDSEKTIVSDNEGIDEVREFQNRLKHTILYIQII